MTRLEKNYCQMINLSSLKNKKTSLVFFLAVTFIIVVSSSFSVMADHWDSFGALIIIWVVFTIGVVVWYLLTVKRTQNTQAKNEKFMHHFIDIANTVNTAEDFERMWNNTLN